MSGCFSPKPMSTFVSPRMASRTSTPAPADSLRQNKRHHLTAHRPPLHPPLSPLLAVSRSPCFPVSASSPLDRGLMLRLDSSKNPDAAGDSSPPQSPLPPAPANKSAHREIGASGNGGAGRKSVPRRRVAAECGNGSFYFIQELQTKTWCRLFVIRYRLRQILPRRGEKSMGHFS